MKGWKHSKMDESCIGDCIILEVGLWDKLHMWNMYLGILFQLLILFWVQYFGVHIHPNIWPRNFKNIIKSKNFNIWEMCISNVFVHLHRQQTNFSFWIIFETLYNTNQLAFKIYNVKYLFMDVLFLKTQQYKWKVLFCTPHSWAKSNEKT